MPTIFNLETGDIIPQTGFAPTQNQNGGWSATRSYYMLADTWESQSTLDDFRRGRSIIDVDDTVSPIYDFLKIESKQVNYEDSGTVLLTVNYTGSPDTQYGGGADGPELSDEALPIYRLEGRLRDVPILEHPKFKKLKEDNEDEFNVLSRIYSGDARPYTTTAGPQAVEQNFDGQWVIVTKDDDTELVFTTDDGIDFYKLLQNGQTTYQATAYVWTETTEGKDKLDKTEVEDLGYIYNDPRGFPFTLPDGRDWLLTSASQEQQGELYRTTIEWMASEPEGWNEFLYKKDD